MERLLHEIAIREEHKVKTLQTQAQKLRKNVDTLWDENVSLRKLHRHQEKEMRDMHEFVSRASLSIKNIRKDVRRGEETCVSVDTELR